MQVTAPTVEPLTIAAAKLQVRLETTADDPLVLDAIRAAREYCESFADISAATTTWRLTLDAFPIGGEWTWGVQGANPDTPWSGYGAAGLIRVPRPPLQSVTTIKYVDLNGTLQTLASTEYRVDADSMPARITPEYGKIWPVTRPVIGAVQVNYVAGYTTVPEKVLQAIRLLFAAYYERREPTPTELNSAHNLLWMAWHGG